MLCFTRSVLIKTLRHCVFYWSIQFTRRIARPNWLRRFSRKKCCQNPKPRRRNKVYCKAIAAWPIYWRIVKLSSSITRCTFSTFLLISFLHKYGTNPNYLMMIFCYCARMTALKLPQTSNVSSRVVTLPQKVSVLSLIYAYWIRCTSNVNVCQRTWWRATKHSKLYFSQYNWNQNMQLMITSQPSR